MSLKPSIVLSNHSQQLKIRHVTQKREQHIYVCSFVDYPARDTKTRTSHQNQDECAGGSKLARPEPSGFLHAGNLKNRVYAGRPRKLKDLKTSVFMEVNQFSAVKTNDAINSLQKVRLPRAKGRHGSNLEHVL